MGFVNVYFESGSLGGFENDILCLLSGTPISNYLVRNFLTFPKRNETSALNRTDMNKHFISTVVRLNETVSFGSVEPFHRTHRHVCAPTSERGDIEYHHSLSN